MTTDNSTPAPNGAQPTPEQIQQAAFAEQRRLAADPDFAKAFANGDHNARARWNELRGQAIGADSVLAARPALASAPDYNTTADADIFAPPSGPHGYSETLDRNQVKTRADEAKLEQLDIGIRKALHAAGLDSGTGNYIIGALNRVAREQPKPDAIAVRHARNIEALRERWGDGFEAKLNAARTVLQGIPEADRKGFIKLLDASGLGADQWLTQRLAAIGEYRASRKAAAK
jgi:hypothetical protein